MFVSQAVVNDYRIISGEIEATNKLKIEGNETDILYMFEESRQRKFIYCTYLVHPGALNCLVNIG